MKPRVKLIVVDDHPVVQQGFTFMFQKVNDMVLLANFSTAESALHFLETHTVDVILLDINLPDRNGIEVCAELVGKYPTIKVLAISNSNEFSIISRMLENGAVGYLLKSCSADELMRCIDEAVDGKIALSAEVNRVLSKNRSTLLPVVTRREQQVLAMLAKGYNSIQIGEQIFISPATVETHRRNLLKKFDVVNVAALVHRANELKYI